MSEATPTNPSQGKVIGALSLLAGSALVLVVILAGMGWLGWRLYRAERRSSDHPTSVLGRDPSGVSASSRPSTSETPGDQLPTAATVLPNRPPDQAATAPVAPATEPARARRTSVELTRFSPTRAGRGEIVTLTGHGLSKTDEVILIPTDAATYFEADAIEHTDTQVTFAVPEMASGTKSLHFALGVFDDDGASLLLDQATPITPDGTPTSHGAVRVAPDGSFTGQDHLLVVAEPGSRVAVGDDCFVILEKDALLVVCGKHCHVFARFDRQVLSPGEIQGDTNLPSIRVTLVEQDFEYRGDQ